MPFPTLARESDLPQRPLVDAIHPVKLKQWRSSLLSTQTWERIAASLSDLRCRQYQIVIDLQGAARSAILARWSGAPSIYGAIQPRESLASLWYTRKNITHRSHVVEQYAEIAQSVIGEARPIPDAIFPCDPVAEQFVEKRLRELICTTSLFSIRAPDGARNSGLRNAMAPSRRRWRAREFHHSLILDRAKNGWPELRRRPVAELRELCRSRSASWSRLPDAHGSSSAATPVPCTWRPRCRFLSWRFSALPIPHATAPSEPEASCCVTRQSDHAIAPDRTRPRFDGHHRRRSHRRCPEAAGGAHG